MKKTFHIILKPTDITSSPQDLVTFLTQKTKLDVAIIKDALNKGAIWCTLKSKKEKTKYNIQIKNIKKIEMNIDTHLLALNIEGEYCIEDCQDYSIWYKPVGLVSQGSPFGDHLSLLDRVEKQLKRTTYLLHRLDRETEGVMIFAHTKPSVQYFSKVWSSDDVKKYYQAIVMGNISEDSGVLNYELDGKSSETHFWVKERKIDKCLIEAELKTGRLHQIRRHFDLFGHPVWGDSKYGKGNKNRLGLMLSSCKLEFIDHNKIKKIFEVKPKILDHLA